jgi:hypothetical protein
MQLGKFILGLFHIDMSSFEEQIRASVRDEVNLQQSRRRTTEDYIQRLHDTDMKVTEFIQQAITETVRAYRLSVNSYIISHLAALAVLASGLSLNFIKRIAPEVFTFSIILVTSSVIWIISLQYRNPVKNSRYMINHLAKLNVIIAGYVRQIHQVDIIFEDLVENNKDITPQVAENLLNNLQDAMTEAINAISMMSTELSD